jgi:hypothetical protein
MREKQILPGFRASSAAIITEIFAAPKSDSIIDTIKAPLPPSGTPGGHLLGMAAKEKPQTIKQTAISSQFKLIFLSVLGLTVVLLVADVLLAHFWTQPTTSQLNVISTVDTVFKACIGAIIGLFGGKLA